MRKYIFLVLLACFLLIGCNNSVKGEIDFKGMISEMEENRILVEDDEKGLVWITLPEDQDSADFEKGQNVAVWTDGKIRESYPLQADALHIEILDE